MVGVRGGMADPMADPWRTPEHHRDRSLVVK